MALIACDLPRSIQVFFTLDRNISYIHLVGFYLADFIWLDRIGLAWILPGWIGLGQVEFCLVVFVWLDMIGLGWILSGCVCMVGQDWARLDFVWLCLYGWIGLGWVGFCMVVFVWLDRIGLGWQKTISKFSLLFIQVITIRIDIKP